MINTDDLVQYLKKIDKKLTRKVTVVAVGGTAMVLMGLKDVTKDVDFCVTRQDYGLVKAAKVHSKLRMDLFSEGYIFGQQLPEDYIHKAKSTADTFQNITLKVLHPVDIIITKTARLNERDYEDIAAIMKNKKIKKETVVQRFRSIQKGYPGANEVLRMKMDMVLREFF